jgi:hypothetical protein
MFRLNSSARSVNLRLRTKRHTAMALSRSSMPEMASDRSSRWSVVDSSSSTAASPTRSPGDLVSLRMLFSIAFRMALAKYARG